MSDFLMANEPFLPPEGSRLSNPLTIYYFTSDQAEGEELAVHFGYFGYHVRIFTSHSDLNQNLRLTTPKAVVVQVDDGEIEVKEVQYLTRLATRPANQVPLIFVGKDDSITVRLKAVRAGASAFFTYPVDVSGLIGAVEELSNPETRIPYRILIISESVSQAGFYALHVERVGMKTRIVTDLSDLFRTLVEFSPDLILLEQLLPDCTGFEVAQVIHQMENFVSVPVVYLSEDGEADLKFTTMDLGGDYLLSKPVKPDHLVSVISSRVRRYRKLRSLMINDSLTGLLNHTSTKERLDIEILRAARGRKPLAYAMIDLDYFKAVNDQYGHNTGDQVLKSLARMFKQRLRRTDLIGRNGGDEFAVIMPDTTSDEAASVIDHLRESFATMHHHTPETTFTLNFSSGIAAFPDYKISNLLVQAADQALYEAKRRGRNRVIQALHLEEPPDLIG